MRAAGALRTPPSNMAGGGAAGARDRCGACRLHAPGQQLKGGDPRIRLAAAMIGDVQHVSTVVDREPGIIGVLNPLHRDGKFGVGTDPTKIVPRQRDGEDRRVITQRRSLIFVWWL